MRNCAILGMCIKYKSQNFVKGLIVLNYTIFYQRAYSIAVYLSYIQFTSPKVSEAYQSFLMTFVILWAVRNLDSFTSPSPYDNLAQVIEIICNKFSESLLYVSSIPDMPLHLSEHHARRIRHDPELLKMPLKSMSPDKAAS